MKLFPNCNFGEKLRGAGRLVVTGKFSKGVYLSGEAGLYLLHDKEFGKIDFGAGVENAAELFALPASEEGSAWELGEGKLVSRGVTLVGAFSEEGLPYNASLNLPALERALAREGKGAICDWYFRRGACDPLAERLGQFLPELLDAMRREDGTAIFESVRRLVGLGRGLTPDADDFLVGLLYGFQERSVPKCFSALVEAVNGAAGNTSPVSREFLRCAAAGKEFTLVTDVLRLPESEEAANRLLSAGHSSGSGIAVGILAALQIIGEKYGKV